MKNSFWIMMFVCALAGCKAPCSGSSEEVPATQDTLADGDKTATVINSEPKSDKSTTESVGDGPLAIVEAPPDETKSSATNESKATTLEVPKPAPASEEPAESVYPQTAPAEEPTDGNAVKVQEGDSLDIWPADGSIFDEPLTVNIRSNVKGAKIHYTTNGATPTTKSPLYRRFRVFGKTTVKAVAEMPDGSLGEVSVAEYARGRSMEPVITSANGANFRVSDNVVSIAWRKKDGTVRYTLDGTEPTSRSAVYTEPFTISDSVVVKAKVFSEELFDSQTMTAPLTREWLSVAAPVINLPESFQGAHAYATIECPTQDACIRYTLDGSEPNSHSSKYTGPIRLTTSTIVKARAFKIDCLASDVASATIDKIWGIGDALNDPNRMFTTNAPGWRCDASVSHDGCQSMRAVSPGNSPVHGRHVSSLISTTVNGPGTVSFWWKTSCESDLLHKWDYAEFRTDGKIWRLDGQSEWKHVVYTFTKSGDHVLTWGYFKDDFGEDGEDCAWLDEFLWTPAKEP